MTGVWERRRSANDVGAPATWMRQRRGSGHAMAVAALKGRHLQIYVGAPSTWEQGLCGSSVFKGGAVTLQGRQCDSSAGTTEAPTRQCSIANATVAPIRQRRQYDSGIDATAALTQQRR